ncbi:hypothetical protein GGI07_005212 [Coemansia sp. Benny D115]|nr:hypothetical protein GGI07_005212 [Coemansia sp. Benny D115]
MNQNPFAFFTSDASGYPQLPDPLGPNPYLDARNSLILKDDSLHTSTMSQDSNDSDSSPSSPSKSKKSDRRTPKSKAEVSERMRRWRSENAEKNRLNDLRCRVYRQARIRFGKDPTPEREAWIQSEIFRRLERRRLREAMKSGGSVPAPTAMTSPTSMALSMGSSGHVAGGPITRSRSTVHPFPMHVGSQSGIPEHAMGFPAPPYTMMSAGGVMYEPGQNVQHNQHQPQYGHNGAMHSAHHNQQPHGQMHHAHGHHQQNQHMQHQHQNNGYLTQTSVYGHAQQHQPQPHMAQHHNQYMHQTQQQHSQQHQQQLQPSHQQHQNEHQLASNFINGAQGSLPPGDIYGNFKFINQFYPGRLLPHQAASPLGSAHPSTTSLYTSQNAQQPGGSNAYLQHHQQTVHQQRTDSVTLTQSHQPQHQHQHQLDQSTQFASTGSGQLGAHTVPSQSCNGTDSSSAAAAAAAAAAAVAAVADLSTSFQLPAGSSQNMYTYYQDSVPSWEPTAASTTEVSNGHSNSSPVTPAETIPAAAAAAAQSSLQYTLHAVGNSSYSLGTSGGQDSTLNPVNASSTSLASLSMVNPVANTSLDNSASLVTDVISGTSDNAESTSASVTSSSANYLYGYSVSSAASPSLNDVASNLFSLRQTTTSASGGVESMSDDLVGNQTSQLMEKSNGSVITAGHEEKRMMVDEGIAHSDSESRGDEDNKDMHHHRQNNMVQGPFNVSAVSDNLQFQNYS